MLKTIRVKQHNYGIVLQFEIQDAEGNPKDLTGLEVILKMWRGDTVKTLTCTVTDTSGLVSCTVSDRDFFDTVGVFLAELELRGQDYVEDTESFLIEVVESQ